MNSLKNISNENFSKLGLYLYEYFNDKKSFLNVEDTVMYTGTHDNDTIVGWYLDFAKNSKKVINLINN